MENFLKLYDTQSKKDFFKIQKHFLHTSGKRDTLAFYIAPHKHRSRAVE